MNGFDVTYGATSNAHGIMGRKSNEIRRRWEKNIEVRVREITVLD